MSAIIRLFTFATTALAVLRLRKREQQEAPFSLRYPRTIVAAALGLCAWLFLSSAWQEARDAGIAAVLGFGIYWLHNIWLRTSWLRRRRQKSSTLPENQAKNQPNTSLSLAQHE